MFGSNKDNGKTSKSEKMLEQYGLSGLSGEDKEIMLDLFESGCFVNSAKALSVFSGGGTVQQISNGLLADLLKSNLMIIRQNDRIIKLLENLK